MKKWYKPWTYGPQNLWFWTSSWVVSSAIALSLTLLLGVH